LPSGRFGASLLALDDFTGDGRLEFAVGSPGANANTGRVSIHTIDDRIRGCTGDGCAPVGTGGIVPNIGTPAGPPIAGSTYEINLTRAPVGRATFLLLGFARFTPGIDLGSVLPQLSGCALYPTADVSLPAGQSTTLDARNTCAAQGWREVSITVPPMTPVGTTFHTQWYVVTPGPFLVPAVMSKVLTSVTE
jgi:hypothetical protein